MLNSFNGDFFAHSYNCSDCKYSPLPFLRGPHPTLTTPTVSVSERQGADLEVLQEDPAEAKPIISEGEVWRRLQSGGDSRIGGW